MKLTREQAEAIARLRGLPEFTQFLHVLGGHAEGLNQRLIMTDDINTDLIRGELRAYTRVQDVVDKAPSIVAQHNQPEEYANGTP